jgi:hypothetical protein
MGIVLAPIVVLTITSSKIVQFAGDWASLPCPLIAERKKTSLHTCTYLFWWKYSIYYLGMKHYVWIVKEPVMVVAITSSKIVQLTWNLASLPCPSKEEHKKHHFTHVPTGIRRG